MAKVYEHKRDGIKASAIEEDNKLYLTLCQDVEKIIDNNKARHNDYMPTVGDEFRQVASIPMVVMHTWEDEMGLPRGSLMKNEHWSDLKRKLNDYDNRFIRTSPGEI